MAGPRIFVPGPNANPGLIGSPAQYLRNIADISKNRRNNQTIQERTAAQQEFNNQRLDLQQQKLDFDLAAPERAIAEEQRLKEVANADAKLFQDTLASIGNSRIDPFLQNEATQAEFQRLGITDPAEQRAMIEAKIAESGDRKIFSDHTKAGQDARAAMIAGGSGLEQAMLAQSAAAPELGFTKMSDAMALKMMDSRNATANSLISSMFGSNKSTGLVEPQLNALNQQELSDILTGKLDVEDSRGGGFIDTAVDTIFGGDPTRSTFDFWSRDLDQQDITRMKGVFPDIPDSALIGALNTVVDPDDGTIDQDQWLEIMKGDTSKPGAAKDFQTAALAVQDRIERKKGSGGAAVAGMSFGDIFKLSDALTTARDNRNLQLANRTAFQNDSYGDRFNFIFGAPQQAAEQTGDTTDGTGSAGLDSLTQTAAVDPKEGSSPGGELNLVDETEVPTNLFPPGLQETLPVQNEITNQIFPNNPNLDNDFSRGAVSPQDSLKLFEQLRSQTPVREEEVTFGDQSITVLRNSEGKYAIPSRPNQWYTKAELEKLAKR